LPCSWHNDTKSSELLAALVGEDTSLIGMTLAWDDFLSMKGTLAL
jgi:hypothetical protein